jgi:WD40 repeat protein
LAVSYSGGPLKLWDLASGRLEGTFGTEGAYVPAISRDGRLLAAPTFGGGTSLWDLRTKRLVGSVEQQVNKAISVAFSSDGQRLVTGSLVAAELQPGLEVWDYVANRGLLSLRSQSSFTGWIEFSPDGNTLLALSWFGLTELWRAPSWAEIEAAEKGQRTP